MTTDNIIGIVCSENLGEAYCLEGSSFQKQLDSKTTITIYIPHYILNPLIHESFEWNCFKWNIKKVLKYQESP